MSRIGKLPVEIPAGVTVNIGASEIAVQGPKGKLNYVWGTGVSVKQEGKNVIIGVLAADRQAKANYGTTRAQILNMVKGVTKGWQKALELNGVGFTAKLNGKTLVLACGYSHEVKVEIPAGVTAKVEKTRIDLDGANREEIGTLAATIREVCPPEPYLGKGIKYSDEVIRRKAGKTGKK